MRLPSTTFCLQQTGNRQKGQGKPSQTNSASFWRTWGQHRPHHVCQTKGKQLCAYHSRQPFQVYVGAAHSQPGPQACSRNRNVPDSGTKVSPREEGSMQPHLESVSEKPGSVSLLCKQLPANSTRCVLSHCPQQQQGNTLVLCAQNVPRSGHRV